MNRKIQDEGTYSFPAFGSTSQKILMEFFLETLSSRFSAYLLLKEFQTENQYF